MFFVDPQGWLPDPPPATVPARGRGAHMISCACTIALGAAPWTEVAVPSLWGESAGPIGWHTTAGAMSTMVAIMVIGLCLIEGRTLTGREAARPGILFLSWVGVAPMALRLYEGPGFLRGVTAAHTVAFYLATLCSLAIALIASWRLHGKQAGTGVDGP
jgi:hypothetical protein